MVEMLNKHVMKKQMINTSTMKFDTTRDVMKKKVSVFWDPLSASPSQSFWLDFISWQSRVFTWGLLIVLEAKEVYEMGKDAICRLATTPREDTQGNVSATLLSLQHLEYLKDRLLQPVAFKNS